MRLESLVKRIKDVKIQGARRIALSSLEYLLTLSKNDLGPEFWKVCEKLERARPTAVVLHNCIEKIKSDPRRETIEKLIKLLRDSPETIARTGRKIVSSKTVMTHCHSTEVVSLLRFSKKVYATETRPLFQGFTTARELSKHTEVILITDSAAGFFMKEVDCVVVGCDALRKEGVVNKIGTLPLGIIAKEFGKPFYVVGNTLKIDRRKEFVIEERPGRELGRVPRSVKVRNPAFDVTPWKYVTEVITEKGVFAPAEIKRLMGRL
ncbi:MAG: translation initiation factor eIF-2B [Candidatus Micrarchaeota archaeon]|nr:translation initiation factor eIF-2B [Candidatus Micrarchaeota archaeon]